MKIFAGFVLAFTLYCLAQILAKWNYRNKTEKAIWFVVIAIGLCWSVTALFR